MLSWMLAEVDFCKCELKRIYSDANPEQKRNAQPCNPGNSEKNPDGNSLFLLRLESKLNWGEPKSMPCERERLPFQKAIFFTRINEMTNRISPSCPRWLMGVSVSQSVSPREELRDKVAARRTSPLRAALRTVKKTGSLERSHQKPEGELVVIWSVCILACARVCAQV